MPNGDPYEYYALYNGPYPGYGPYLFGEDQGGGGGSEGGGDGGGGGEGGGGTIYADGTENDSGLATVAADMLLFLADIGNATYINETNYGDGSGGGDPGNSNAPDWCEGWNTVTQMGMNDFWSSVSDRVVYSSGGGWGVRSDAPMTDNPGGIIATVSNNNICVQVDNPTSPPSSGGFFDGLLHAIGLIWNSPNTALGLIYGAVGYVAGWVNYAVGGQANPPQILIQNNAIQFTNSPIQLTAQTTGNSIVYATGAQFQPGYLKTYANGVQQTLESEEVQHTFQGQVLGPLYLPLHLILQAAALVIDGDHHGATNVLEQGPHSPNPTPWGN